MSLIEYKIGLHGPETYDKVGIAMQRLRSFEPPEGYFLAFSGGKDSCVLKALADMAGVKYDAHYSVTSVDPPELVRFIRECHPDVAFDIPHDRDGKSITMWNLIPQKLMPPTRVARYCCAVLKESNGRGRITLTGVRWAESANRRKNRNLVHIGGKKDGIVLANDNNEARRMVESCYKKRKTVVNPIIDWENEDVWEFIHAYHIPYCKLYDEGFTRLGCIGCPMNTHAKEEFDRYHKYRDAYLRAFGRMLEVREESGMETKWASPEDVMAWWLGEPAEDEDRLDMFEDIEEDTP